MQNLEQTIISQYGTSPILNQLIQNMNAYLDPSADIDNFYNYVFNVDTAQGFGLDFWGKIVDVSRQITLTQAQVNFGFNDGANDYAPFGQAPYYNGPIHGSYLLSDSAYRTLILVKALANISNCSVQSYNRLLQNLFAGRGRCYVSDTGKMSMIYVFEFALYPYEEAIMVQSGALPRPTGVQARLLYCDMSGTLGFSEATASNVSFQPFGQGVFGQSLITVS